MLDKLQKHSSVLRIDLAAALCERFTQCRNKDLNGLLIYLQNPKKYEQEIKIPKRTVMCQEIKKILAKIYTIGENEDEENEDVESIDDSQKLAPTILSLKK